MSIDDGIRTCRHCLWDIAQAKDGTWRLAWDGDDLSTDDDCVHEPRPREAP